MPGVVMIHNRTIGRYNPNGHVLVVETFATPNDRPLDADQPAGRFEIQPSKSRGISLDYNKMSFKISARGRAGMKPVKWGTRHGNANRKTELIIVESGVFYGLDINLPTASFHDEL
jgi:hypothetical protein